MDPTHQKVKYRPDIDGLRAIAVISVIIFHLVPKRLAAGFIGVDVFFVISGFLISTIIFTGIEQDTFSLLGFYNRRLRRIFPSLLVVLAAVLVVGYFTFLADEYSRLGKHVAAGAGFVSNLVLQRESGYFDADASTKPLLHLWSLGIEEQFYLFWPLALMLLRRFKLGQLPFMLGVAICSFVGNLYLVTRNPSADFYWPITRVWELALGGILAYAFLKRPKTLLSGQELRSWAGLLLVVAGLTLIRKGAQFPGVWALLPTAGTFLLISAGPLTIVNRRLLSAKPLVWIGIISYPLYLWHWVILATYRILGFHAHGASILIITSSLALSILTYFAVEKPLRTSPSKWVPIGLLLAMTVVGVVGWSIHQAGGLEGSGYRSPERTAFANRFENALPQWQYFEREQILSKYNTKCDFYDIEKFRRGEETQVPRDQLPVACYQRDGRFSKVIFIWGDSHAQQFYYGLSRQLPSDWQIQQVASSGCAPEISEHDSDRRYCERSNWFALKSISAVKPDVVLVGQNEADTVEHMTLLAQRLHALGAKQVLFMGPSPHWTRDLPKIILREFFGHTPRRTSDGLDEHVIGQDTALTQTFPQTADTRYVSVSDYFCNKEGCLVYLGDDVETGITTWDYGHLTPVASDAFAKEVLAPLVVSGSR